MNFEEIDFYIFYVNYLSKKEYENKKVLVGYNGVNRKEVTMSKFKSKSLVRVISLNFRKEVTMSKFKEDINELRDSRSIYRREVEKNEKSKK